MTVRRSAILSVALVSALALSGCGNDPNANAGANIIKAVAVGLATRAKGGGAPAPAAGITREQLNQIKTPMMMVNLTNVGTTAFFVPYGQNGAVETWASPEGQTISFRGGVMVATRGFGGDIMQSAGPSIGQIASGSGKHTRIYDYLDGADQNLRREFVCTLRNAGMETITVVDRQHTTRHIVEDCTGNGGQFTNEYWFEGGTFLRKSKQLINIEWGHLDLQRVVDNG